MLKPFGLNLNFSIQHFACNEIVCVIISSKQEVLVSYHPTWGVNTHCLTDKTLTDKFGISMLSFSVCTCWSDTSHIRGLLPSQGFCLET